MSAKYYSIRLLKRSCFRAGILAQPLHRAERAVKVGMSNRMEKSGHAPLTGPCLPVLRFSSTLLERHPDAGTDLFAYLTRGPNPNLGWPHSRRSFHPRPRRYPQDDRLDCGVIEGIAGEDALEVRGAG